MNGVKPQTPFIAGASREDYARLCVLRNLDFYPAPSFGCNVNLVT